MNKLQVLCLHGSRQDGEIFSQRLSTLARKLEDVADLHFVDAPHELPLQEGQTVPMRAWWRHPHLMGAAMPATSQPEQEVAAAATTASPSSKGPAEHPTDVHADGTQHVTAAAAGSLAELQAQQVQRQQQMLHDQQEAKHKRQEQMEWLQRQLHQDAPVAPDTVPLYDEHMVPDWDQSLQVLRNHWHRHGGYDVVLGFSNGAAASFLLACHIIGQPTAWPGRKLKCVVLAGGYVPEPLARLVPDSLHVTRPDTHGHDTEAGAPSSHLAQPLKLPSLHISSSRDQAVTSDQSKTLAEQFDASRRQMLSHDLGHCVPQKPAHCEAISEFLSWFEPSQPTPAANTAPVQAPLPVQEQTATASAAPASPSTGLQQANGSSLSLQGLDLNGAPVPSPTQDPDQEGPSATPEQQEEMDALQAIYDQAYTPLSTTGPRFKISLRDPGQLPTTQGDDDGPPLGSPASAYFSLIFTLPSGYPEACTPPEILLDGPVTQKDPVTTDLITALQARAAEEMQATGAGCCYQLVEFAREWLDEHLPAGFGDPKAANGSVAVDESVDPEATPWWEKEEADGELIRQAIQKASLAHWAHHGGLDTTPPDDDTVTDSDMAQEVGTGVPGTESGSGGRWDYVIGLVGKPSAGKSSLFNALTGALTDGEGAKVAAQPFTTIAPNIGRGWVVVPDPCRACGLDPGQCRPTHGFAPAFDPERVPRALANAAPLMHWVRSAPWGDQAAWRRVPILIKDVAGLVPGAYAGRGRGNAFLNDLCDADVLIHVVDASGSTDREGRPAEPGEGADPLDDVGWVREEIHRWVYDNVKAKWAVVRRRPTRLPDMLTGYHVSRAMVLEILERVGLPPTLLSSDSAAPLLASWGEAELHGLVAAFLAARFPILLALNKVDLPAAEEHVRRIRAALPHEPAVPISAACERWLAAQALQGHLLYKAGADSVEATANCQDGNVQKRVQEVQRRVLTPFGGTNTLLAASVAMAMRPPRLLYPVSDTATCTAMVARSTAGGQGVLLGAEDAKARAAEGNTPSVLRDVLLLKPGSTVWDAYTCLKKPPWQLLEGDYVRAECRVLHAAAGAAGPDDADPHQSSSHQKHVLKKDDVVTLSNCVVRIMVNRKAGGWQK